MIADTDATALVPKAADALIEADLAPELIEQARDYASQARAARTLAEYAKFWRKFAAWCEANGRQALPASPQTLIGYVTWMASGQDKGRSLSVATIRSHLAAIKFCHKAQGQPVTTDHPMVRKVWDGIRRSIALHRTTRRVTALTADKLREIMELLRPDVIRDVRDAAVLALAFCGALRRSELVGLDWHQLGEAEDPERLGYLKSTPGDDGGLTITLMRSKASQATAEEVTIPRDYAPILCRAVETWVEMAKVRKGEPLLRGLKGTGHGHNNPQSGYRGVCWHTPSQRWRAQTSKGKHLGYFETPEQAHAAYCAATGTALQVRNQGVVSPKRLDQEVVAIIVKRRIRQWVLATNKKRGIKKLSAADVDALVAEYSGHSLRAGSVTSMAEAGVPTHLIKLVSRHKSDQMVSTYVRPVEKRKNWGLKTVAF